MKLAKRTLIFCLSFLSVAGYGQERGGYELSLEEATGLALKNHQTLRVAAANVALREQQTEVARLQQLPTVSLSANAFYLGDALLLNTDLSKLSAVDLPNFGNTYALQASQLLYKGGLIQKSIGLAELQTQLANLDLVQDIQTVKFLVTSHYLDIQKILNQKTVYEQNKILARQRLANVTQLYEQDMVTRNELIRAELQIKNLEQAIVTLDNSHAILSNRLSYALGLPEDALIVPTEKMKERQVSSLPYYMDLAYRHHPALQSAEMNVSIAEKNIGIVKTDLFPSVSAFASYNMQRPLTSVSPALDLYNNTWQAGISLTYNIDNLFKTRERVRSAERQRIVLEEKQTLSRQNIGMEVNTAFIRYQESKQQALLMEESQRLANENYRIIEARYLNQLAITAEMTDAATAKLEAELQYVNAGINVMFQYYNLLKSTGTL